MESANTTITIFVIVIFLFDAAIVSGESSDVSRFDSFLIRANSLS